VNLNELEQQWSHVLEPQTKACLLKLKEDGLIDFNPPHVRLTHRGVLFADFVASEVI
jgi:coproporphyrinogen III oxidase-like Fe-S oxidoreductase